MALCKAARHTTDCAYRAWAARPEPHTHVLIRFRFATARHFPTGAEFIFCPEIKNSPFGGSPRKGEGGLKNTSTKHIIWKQNIVPDVHHSNTPDYPHSPATPVLPPKGRIQVDFANEV